MSKPLLKQLMDQKPILFFILLKGRTTHALSLLFLISFVAWFDAIKHFQYQSLLGNGSRSQNVLNSTSSTAEPCDYSYGKWVWDESVPLKSYNEDCPFLDQGFKCHKNGRIDEDFRKWRWQPHGCDLPRFRASDMLQRSRNRRIVFAGDSIGRNQWESLLCMLAQEVSNQSSIYEENGNPITKHRGYLSIRFRDYNLTVEYYRVPFLVLKNGPPKNSPLKVRGAIHVDKLHWLSEKWTGADVLVFNTGHWWNQEKTFIMNSYFQEGEALNLTMNIKEAFRITLQTWKHWAIASLGQEDSFIFFRSYSSVHFREGNWSDGGTCGSESAPEMNHSQLYSEPWNNIHIAKTIEEINTMKTKVQFLNITYLTDIRKDGHPSIYYIKPGTVPFKQDCSHWCLPGVPDTWNEILYAYLLSNGYSTKNNRQEMWTG